MIIFFIHCGRGPDLRNYDSSKVKKSGFRSKLLYLPALGETHSLDRGSEHKDSFSAGSSCHLYASRSRVTGKREDHRKSSYLDIRDHSCPYCKCTLRPLSQGNKVSFTVLNRNSRDTKLPWFLDYKTPPPQFGGKWGCVL